jgi:hypothetical protein
MMNKVIMNVKNVLTNVKFVLKNLKLVLFVLLKELMLQLVLVLQVSSMNQKILNVLDVLKNVKLVPLVVLVSLVTTQDSMPQNVTAQWVNSKFVVLKVSILISHVMLNVQIHNVTIVLTNVLVVLNLLKTVILVLVTELTNQIVFAQMDIMIPVLLSVHNVILLVSLVNSTKDVV